MERRSPYTHPATLATRQKSQAHPHSPQAGSDFPRAPYFPANPYLAKKPAEKHPHPKARIWSLVPHLHRNLRPLIAAALVLLLAVGVLICATSAHRDSQGAWISDPASQWRLGTVPHLYQTDPAWSQKPYAGATIGTSGCGPTCLSAVYIALTGNTNFTPVDAAALATRDGHIIDGLTAWTLMDAGAATLGLTSHTIPADPHAVQQELSCGHPLIASMGPGDFTSSGHFIVFASIDDAGQLRVMDPNSEPRSQQSWDLERTLSQVRGLWSFSAAG